MGQLQTIQRTQRFIVIDCCSCGISFCMTEDMQNRRRDDGKSFFCPNGHSQSYTESTVDRLRKELEAKDKLLLREKELSASYRRTKDTAMRSAAASRGAITKLKKRINHGVCPCCQRAFKQLAAHMKAKHPDFLKEQE